MLLCIDIGNTNIVIGVYNADELVLSSRISSDRSRLGDQYAVEIKDILGLYGFKMSDIDNAIISSVVPSLTGAIAHSIEAIFGFKPLILGPGTKTGLNIKIDDPAQLGSDFVAGAVAAKKLYKPPLVVIDMGTATTFSVIDKNGDFLGGSILPGLRVATDALVGRTSLLQLISFEAPASAIGKNTADSMNAGAIFGTAAMIDGMCERYFDEIGERATVVATGGIAPSVVPYCRTEIIVNDLLLLEGLKDIYERNKK